MELLTDEQITGVLRQMAWRRRGDEIYREFRCSDFAAAMAFVNRVAAAAEAADHHPDILVHDWNRVRFTLTTHSAGGLTDRDFELARVIDGLA